MLLNEFKDIIPDNVQITDFKQGLYLPYKPVVPENHLNGRNPTAPPADQLIADTSGPRKQIKGIGGFPVYPVL